MVEQALLTTKRKLAKEQDEFESEESAKESNDDGQLRSKWEDEKTQLDVRWGVYCTNCYNEGHYTKECKSLQKLCICKSDDHDID